MPMSLANRFSILVLVVASSGALAQMDRGGFQESKSQGVTNLLKEGESVSVLNEISVQQKEFSSRRVYNLVGGQMAAGNLTLTSHEHIIKYDLSKPMDMIGTSIGYFPYSWHGLWGLEGGVNYGFRNQKTRTIETVLHVTTGDLLLMYKGETNPRNWVKPFLGIGATLITVVQRGDEGFNTSEARGMGLGVLGLGFNVNRLFSMDSMLDWEVIAQYRSVFGPTKPSADWTGTSWNAGVSLSL
jgi:hypothetical protein